MQLFSFLNKKRTFFCKRWTIYGVAFVILLIYTHQLTAQKTYEWEIDRIEKREKEQKRVSDSLMSYLKNRWEIKLSVGMKTWNKASRSTEEEPFFFPNTMALWKLGGAYHIGERLTLDISFGIQLGRDVPRPDVISVLNGEDFQIEGSGGIFIPTEIGGIYYLMTKRYRPYIGMSLGSVLIRSQYTQAEGNLSTGILQTEFQSRDRVGLGTLRMGVDYRLNNHVQANANFSYYVSGKFEEPMGGYTSYTGGFFGLGFSLIPN